MRDWKDLQDLPRDAIGLPEVVLEELVTDQDLLDALNGVSTELVASVSEARKLTHGIYPTSHRPAEDDPSKDSWQ